VETFLRATECVHNARGKQETYGRTVKVTEEKKTRSKRDSALRDAVHKITANGDQADRKKDKE
jgi:hypothetical protein